MDINIYGGENLIAPNAATIELHIHIKIIQQTQNAYQHKKHNRMF